MIEYLKDAFLRQLKPKKAIFIHIQKTAGTSIVHLAAENYGNENIISHGDYVNYQPSDLINTPFISGHFGYEYAQTFMDDRKSFTFMRNPKERILSLYYFYRSQPADIYPMYQIAHDNSLEEFLKLGFEDPLVKSQIWNHQTWQLAFGYGRKIIRSFTDFTEEEILTSAKKNLTHLDYVGLAENFDNDVKVISQLLNWKMQNIQIKKNRNKKRESYDNLTVSERALLKELTQLDDEIYSQVKKQANAPILTA